MKPPPPVSSPGATRSTRPFWLRPERALFALALGTYAYFYQAGGWNQNVRFDLVRAVVEQGRLRINGYHGNTGDKARRGRHYFADKAPGVSFLAVPAYAALHATAGHLRDTDRFQAAASYACTVWAVSLPSALAVGALYTLLRALSLPAAGAAVAALAYAFGTLAFPYSTLLYGHQTAAALLLLAFSGAALGRRTVVALGRGRLLAVGATLGVAVAVEYPAALGALVIALYATRARPARAAWLAAGAALPLALLGWYHAAAFGSPTSLPYSFSTQPHRQRGFFMGLGLPDPAVLLELLFGHYRGLFRSAPWLVLALPGAARWLRDRATRAEGAVCLAVPVLYLWLNVSLDDWHGGRGFGPRHLIPALPFLTVLAAGILPAAGGHVRLALARAMAAAAVLAVAFSAVVMLAGTAVGPEVSWRVRWPLEDVLLPAFREGRLAVSTQSIDMLLPRGNVRFAWNVGEKLGLSGRASLLPLGLWTALGGIWLVRAVRHDQGPGALATTAS